MIDKAVLQDFPFASLLKVKQYDEQCLEWSTKFSQDQSSKYNRNFGEARQRAQEGMYCKVASALIQEQDPIAVINFEYKSGTFDYFIGEKEALNSLKSDAMKVGLEVLENKESLTISMMEKKYKRILKSIEKENYAGSVDFMYMDLPNELIYHLGKVQAEDFPAPSGLTANGSRVLLTMNLSDFTENNVYLLS
jgi:hypothetical protein